MALVKAKEAASGHVSEYWRIVEIRGIDYITRNSLVMVSLYKDQAARLAARAPVETFPVGWEGDAFPFDAAAMVGINVQEAAYRALKAPRPVEQQRTVLAGGTLPDGTTALEDTVVTEMVESNFFADAIDA